MKTIACTVCGHSDCRHAQWRASIARTTQAMVDKPHRVSGLPGRFYDGQFHRGDAPRRSEPESPFERVSEG